MMKYIPWHKNHPLPPNTKENYISMFNNFQKTQYYPPSVSISIKRAQNRIENYQKEIKEPMSNEVVNSQPVQNNISTDIQDLLKTTTNLKDTANIFEKLEQQGFDIGKHYNWNKRIYKVIFFFLCIIVNKQYRF
jgi:Na+/phosphate symporter